jgi:hypothetical protein
LLVIRRLADKVASRGYFVVLPDFFRGDPFLPAEGPNIIAGLDKWWVRHTPVSASFCDPGLLDTYISESQVKLIVSGRRRRRRRRRKRFLLSFF